MTDNIDEATTLPAKYVFLDVVGFTQGRSVEAQSDIVCALNEIVAESVAEHSITPDRVIFLPTGDGMCIALLNVESPYDIHLLIALAIIKKVQEFNEATPDEMRQFRVRIGLNANTDNLVTDINRNRNIAGAGVSIASRIMNQADGNQILAGESVYDTLRYREKYMSAFRRHVAKGKHDFQFPVYQLIQESHKGLEIGTPRNFEETQKADPKLSKLAAYYFAHAIKNREFFLENKEADRPATVLLYFLAQDSVERAETSPVNTPYLQAYKAEEEASIVEQFKYYESLDIPVASGFGQLIVKEHLNDYRNCFEGGFFQYQFINSLGVEKLAAEWPDIYAEILNTGDDPAGTQDKEQGADH